MTQPLSSALPWHSIYFTLAELINSDKAWQLKIDNVPTPEIAAVLAETAAQMDRVRIFLSAPVIVSSGYRSKALNKAVKGQPTSGHMLGYCIDFTCPKFGSPKAICEALAKSNIPFDQLIMEGTWVHISFDPRLRRQTLIKNAKGVVVQVEGF